ncbi:MAG: glycosyltransferase [Prevotella sp.]|nr:glycosyltransferase [Prevotella sp.]
MKYSIITINYNNKKGLEKTIKSVLSQTFKDYQFIIIDGGSTDGSDAVIKSYADHINYWVSEPDGGRYPAMNKGIKQATGDYLNFMNSGDTFHSSTVLEDITKMGFTEDIITGGFFDREKAIKHIIMPQEVTLLTMFKNTFNHQATFYRRELFQKRLYDENYIIQSDAKFNYLSIIHDNCSARIIDYIVADYDFNGISSNLSIVDKEWDRLLAELFPQRILKDYKSMYTPAEVPLVSLLPELKDAPSVQRWVYRFASFLLKCKKFVK